MTFYSHNVSSKLWLEMLAAAWQNNTYLFICEQKVKRINYYQMGWCSLPLCWQISVTCGCMEFSVYFLKHLNPVSLFVQVRMIGPFAIAKWGGPGIRKQHLSMLGKVFSVFYFIFVSHEIPELFWFLRKTYKISSVNKNQQVKSTVDL